MRFLIIGCNGMAVHVISVYLSTQGHDVTGYARQKSRFVNTVIGDATDFDRIKKHILKNEYDSVINCVGILNQYGERDHVSAILLNSYLPHFLAKITEGTQTQIIHMSTDCVFSGKTGGYTEDSIPDGILFYDKSKAIGELVDEKNITIRSSIVGPDLKPQGIGLLNWFLQQKESVNGFTRAIWTGQTTLQLARTMELAAKFRAHGLFHMVPDQSINKYDLLQLFNTYLRRKSIDINPCDDYISDKSLVRTRYEGFEYRIPNYQEMMMELGNWLREYKSIYPHYDI